MTMTTSSTDEDVVLSMATPKEAGMIEKAPFHNGGAVEAAKPASVEVGLVQPLPPLAKGLANVRLPLGEVQRTAPQPEAEVVATFTTTAAPSFIAHGLANVKLPLPSGGKAEKAGPVADDGSIPRKIVVGDEVTSVFGRGKVLDIREENGIHVVEAIGWLMADDSKPRYYMSVEALKYAKPRTVYQLTTYEKLETAAKLKEEGGKMYQDKNYQAAAQSYVGAIEVISYMDKASLTHSERARMLGMLVPCFNNSALCELKQENPKNAQGFAMNAESLCRTLSENQDSKVWKCLREQGFTPDKVCVQWRSKALFHAGKASTMNGDHTSAAALLEVALNVIKDQPGMEKDLVNINKLLSVVNKRCAVEKQAEKRMWNKAFNKSSSKSSEPEEVVRDTAGGVKGKANGKSKSKKPKTRVLNTRQGSNRVLKVNGVVDVDELLAAAQEGANEGEGKGEEALDAGVSIKKMVIVGAAAAVVLSLIMAIKRRR